MTLKKQTVNGIKWLIGASFVQRILSIGTTIILARILTPSIFGLFTLAFVVIDGLSLFRSMGFDSAVIQRKDDTLKAANTAFLIVPLLGLSIYLILSIFASSISNFFNNVKLVPVLKILGLFFIISSLSNIPRAILQGQLKFDKISIAEICGQLSFSIVSIILALSGFEIWSLVIAYLIKVITILIIIWQFAHWSPKFEFDKKIALEMFQFGKFIFLSSIIWFIRANFDKIVVGKLMGTVSVGLYAIAYNIAYSGSQYFGSKIYKVLFPAYSKLQDNLDGLRSAFKKVLRYLSIIVLPLGIGIFLLGGDFLHFAFGEKWLRAIPLVRVLAWAGIFTSIAAGSGSMFLALGKSKLDFTITSLQTLFFLILVIPFAKMFDANGVVAVVTFIAFISMLLRFYWIRKLLLLKFTDIFNSLKPALLSSLIMAAGIIICKNTPILLILSTSSAYNFILMFSFALILYCMSMRIMNRNIFGEIKNLIFM